MQFAVLSSYVNHQELSSLVPKWSFFISSILGDETPRNKRGAHIERTDALLAPQVHNNQEILKRSIHGTLFPSQAVQTHFDRLKRFPQRLHMKCLCEPAFRALIATTDVLVMCSARTLSATNPITCP